MFIRTENFKQYLKLYPVVSTIIGLNILAYLLSKLPIIGFEIYYRGMLINELVADGQWWRVITALFLHGSFIHILFNMFFLFIFGPDLERIVGKVRFITIYLISGLFSNVATYVFQFGEYASVGSSGAIYGIFGAYAALVYYNRNTVPQLRQMIMPIIIICIIMSFFQPIYNTISHFAGLITGVALGLFYFSPKNILRWRMK